MNKVAIVDYGMGNVDSVARAVEEAGCVAVVTDKECDFGSASSIIFPGVGAFAEGARNLRAKRLDCILTEQVIGNKIPFLGICLGMQLLAATGLEGGKTAGLGWIDGEVVKLCARDKSERIPHVGWNSVDHRGDPGLFRDIPSGKDFYFVHSYRFVVKNRQDVAATTEYCGEMVSAVRKDNIFGVQFHPEKSLEYGLKLIRNFLLFAP